MLLVLPENSPVFFGRRQVLHEILGVLRRPGNPGCVSLLGERRIGKSSLLNQVCQALSAEHGLITIFGNAQNWNNISQEEFFSSLCQSVHGVPLDKSGSMILPYSAPEHLQVYELDHSGIGIHWPLLDEDLSIEGLLRSAGRKDLIADHKLPNWYYQEPIAKAS